MTALILLILAGLIDICVLAKLMYAFRLLTMRRYELPSEDKLPTVTICIPARNEIHGMTNCLDRVVASDYPKLEIIVLDDESRDETSVLIKSYASSGVRFIEGKPLLEGWLGKNYAQSVLAHEASGQVVFFMDVDTLVRPKTISQAVAYMLAQKATMVSIIPLRDDTWRASAVFATLRHFWTVIRFRPVSPRAASNAWLIKRELLLQYFDTNQALSASVQIETTIARVLAVEHAFRLVISNPGLGMTYEKKWRSQCETSIRLLYPQCNRHWYHVLGVAIVLMLPLVPYGLFFWQPIICVLLVFLQYVVAWYYLHHVWSRYSWIGALVTPLIIVQELILLVMSLWQYHFGTITWKGRPIMAGRQATPTASKP